MYGSARELLARGRHKIYLRERIAEGETPEINSSLVSWEELPSSLRESNRNFADSMAAKLAGVGATLAPLEGSQPSKLRIAPDVLEQLAQAEHDRWSRDLLRNGWKSTEGPKDAIKKLHPSLVSWEELSEPERDKDRESILAIPEMFASVGFDLRFD